MKVSQIILKEALDIKQIGDVWRIIDTETGDFASNIVYKSAGEAEAARDVINAKAKKPQAPEIRATRNEPDPDPVKDKKPLKTGVRLGTPTRGQLTRGQLRKLARTGKITVANRFSGKKETFTKKQIMAATAEARKMNKFKDPDFTADKKDTTLDKLKDKLSPEKMPLLKKLIIRLSSSATGGLIAVITSWQFLEDVAERYVAVLERVGGDYTHPHAEYAYHRAKGEIINEVAAGFGALLGTFAGIAAFLKWISKTPNPGWIVTALAGTAGSIALSWAARFAANNRAFHDFVADYIMDFMLSQENVDQIMYGVDKMDRGIKTSAKGVTGVQFGDSIQYENAKNRRARFNAKKIAQTDKTLQKGLERAMAQGMDPENVSSADFKNLEKKLKAVSKASD